MAEEPIGTRPASKGLGGFRFPIMYGLINRALQQYLVSDYGHEAWNRMAKRANWLDDEFVSMEIYDDAITYSLLAAAAEELELPTDEILESFGFFWPRFAASRGYGVLMEMTGETFEEFLRNLDNLHTRIALSYPQLQPPSFSLENLDDDCLSLRYYSRRPGLAPMVAGILHALAENFGLQVDVSFDATAPSEGDAEERSCLFTIRASASESHRAA